MPLKLSKLVNVVDLEASCWLGKPPVGMRQEIIEIGLAVVDTEKLEVVHKEAYLCRPQDSNISEFCTRLTSITADMLATQPTFQDHVKRILKEQDGASRHWISWGEYDRKQVGRDVAYHMCDNPFSNQHTNLKEYFAKKRKMKQGCGLDKAVEMLGLPFSGQHHRGVDDAYNTALILIAELKQEREPV